MSDKTLTLRIEELRRALDAARIKVDETAEAADEAIREYAKINHQLRAALEGKDRTCGK